MARRAKQMTIEGTQQNDYPDIEEAADRYREIRDSRMELTKDEVKAKAALLAAMKAHDCEAYKLGDGAIVKVTAKEDVKVNTPKDDEVDGADDLIEDEAA
jgi:hypothetical protein